MALYLKKLVMGWAAWRHVTFLVHNHRTSEPMIGEFRADYSRLTPEEIAQEDAELTELYANSIPASC
jgi:hypothetical protein